MTIPIDTAETLLQEGARRALEAVWLEVKKKEVFLSGIPCPDGIKGCPVYHYQELKRPRNTNEIMAALVKLNPKSIIVGGEQMANDEDNVALGKGF